MGHENRVWTAALIVIGDEILSGRTEDRNVAQVARWLNEQGVRLAEVRVVPDVEERIVEAVNTLRAEMDYVFTTGGIGPTHDDITIDAIAQAFDVPVIVHPEARRILEEYYAQPGRRQRGAAADGAGAGGRRADPEPQLRRAGREDGQRPHPRRRAQHRRARMLDALTGTLKGGRPVVSATVTAHAPESEVADLLRQVQGEHAGVSIGSYPFYRDGRFGADFVIRAEDPELVERCADALRSRLKADGFRAQLGARLGPPAPQVQPHHDPGDRQRRRDDPADEDDHLPQASPCRCRRGSAASAGRPFPAAAAWAGSRRACRR